MTIAENLVLENRFLFKYQTNSILSPYSKNDCFAIENNSLILEELKYAKILLKIKELKIVYLFNGFKGSKVLEELGRIREISFQSVGEGTGNRIDLDTFDYYYQHIILWDVKNSEIIGSYRIGNASNIISDFGVQGLYTSSLFTYSNNSNHFLEQGLELGRSFMKQEYWGKRGLDFLWMGIGAYLSQNPKIRYLFGPVSISARLSNIAINLILSYYQIYFYYDKNEIIAKANTPFITNKYILEYVQNNYPSERELAFVKLKNELQELGFQVPPLYKQYTDLCDAKGINFLSFSIDAEFNFAVDSLILVDLHYLKEGKRKKYVSKNSKALNLMESNNY